MVTFASLGPATTSAFIISLALDDKSMTIVYSAAQKSLTKNLSISVFVVTFFQGP